MNNFFTPLQIARSSLKANKLRTLLTVLGMVIGISSVMIILSAGQAMKQYFIAQVNAFGSNYIEVEVKVPSTKQASTENAFGQASGVTITTLTVDDARAIEALPNIDKIYAGDIGQDIVVYQEKNQVTTLYGVTGNYIDIDTSKIDQGRFFTDEEDDNLSQVVVLGSKVKQDLFGNNDFLGKRIKIGRTNFTVIGSLQDRGGALFFDLDDMVYIPVQTLQKKIEGIDYISIIVATMHDTSLDQVTKLDIEDLLRERHSITDPYKDDFAVTTQEEAQDLLSSILDGLQILLIAIASISLIVGGVGIMNIMYVSVSERKYEIGLRKSVGATKRSILWQFLWEAVGITGVGGLMGVLLGVLVSFGISQAADIYGFAFVFTIPPQAFIIAVGFSVVVGLVFGLYPARQAAEFDPIDALRKIE